MNSDESNISIPYTNEPRYKFVLNFGIPHHPKLTATNHDIKEIEIHLKPFKNTNFSENDLKESSLDINSRIESFLFFFSSSQMGKNFTEDSFDVEENTYYYFADKRTGKLYPKLSIYLNRDIVSKAVTKSNRKKQLKLSKTDNFDLKSIINESRIYNHGKWSFSPNSVIDHSNFSLEDYLDYHNIIEFYIEADFPNKNLFSQEFFKYHIEKFNYEFFDLQTRFIDKLLFEQISTFLPLKYLVEKKDLRGFTMRDVVCHENLVTSLFLAVRLKDKQANEEQFKIQPFYGNVTREAILEFCAKMNCEPVKILIRIPKINLSKLIFTYTQRNQVYIVNDQIVNCLCSQPRKINSYEINEQSKDSGKSVDNNSSGQKNYQENLNILICLLEIIEKNKVFRK